MKKKLSDLKGTPILGRQIIQPRDFKCGKCKSEFNKAKELLIIIDKVKCPFCGYGLE